jgi:hypothetical protein
MTKFGSVNPVSSLKSKILKKIKDKEEDEAMTIPELEADIVQDKKTLKAKKTPKEAHRAEIDSMAYRKKTGNPTMATMSNGGGSMRAKDIKVGSRKRGAY